jgi:hypothetical protein
LQLQQAVKSTQLSEVFGQIDNPTERHNAVPKSLFGVFQQKAASINKIAVSLKRASIGEVAKDLNKFVCLLLI